MSRPLAGRVTANPSGTFTASVPVARGSAKRKYRTFPTQAAADRWRLSCVAAVEAGQPLPVEAHADRTTAVANGTAFKTVGEAFVRARYVEGGHGDVDREKQVLRQIDVIDDYLRSKHLTLETHLRRRRNDAQAFSQVASSVPLPAEDGLELALLAPGLRSISRASSATSACTSSFWLATDTYSPVAMLKAPATSPATPVMTTTCPLCPLPPTRAISETFVTRPSIAPNTAGRSQPPETSRCECSWRSVRDSAITDGTGPPRSGWYDSVEDPPGPGLNEPRCRGLTSWVPASPRALSERRNAAQNTSTSLSQTARPKSSPVGGDDDVRSSCGGPGRSLPVNASQPPAPRRCS